MLDYEIHIFFLLLLVLINYLLICALYVLVCLLEAWRPQHCA